MALSAEDRFRVKQAISERKRAEVRRNVDPTHVYIPRPDATRTTRQTRSAKQYRERVAKLGREALSEVERDYYARRQILAGYTLSPDRTMITCTFCGYTGNYRGPYRHYKDCPSGLGGRRTSR